MDDPATGLHMSDIGLLLGIMNRLVDTGNTLIVTEHNLGVISQADWIIDRGPDGGARVVRWCSRASLFKLSMRSRRSREDT